MWDLTGNDNIFTTWLDNRDKVTYNLFCHIKDHDPLLLKTDDRYWIAAQADRTAPLWLYFRSSPDTAALAETAELIYSTALRNRSLHIIAEGEFIATILNRVSEKLDISYDIYMKTNAYSCETPILQNPFGTLTKASSLHHDKITELIKTMKADSEGKHVGDEEAEDFYHYAISSGNVFLWNDGGIRSMANIAYRTDRFARINTIVTDRNSRGKGYAGMLVSELSRHLLSEGLIPVIYADANYPPSNRTYRRIGFQKQGELTEYAFHPIKKKERSAF